MAFRLASTPKGEITLKSLLAQPPIDEGEQGWQERSEEEAQLVLDLGCALGLVARRPTPRMRRLRALK